MKKKARRKRRAAQRQEAAAVVISALYPDAVPPEGPPPADGRSPAARLWRLVLAALQLYQEARPDVDLRQWHWPSAELMADQPYTDPHSYWTPWAVLLRAAHGLAREMRSPSFH